MANLAFCESADSRCLRGRCGDARKLRKMIQVVAGHGFDDGLKCHGAALGMGDGRFAGCRQRAARSGAGSSCAARRTSASASSAPMPEYGGCPFVLIEGLDDVVVLGQRLAQPEAEDQFAVGEMRRRSRPRSTCPARAPVTHWSGPMASSSDAIEPAGVAREWHRAAAIEEFVVGVLCAHRNSSVSSS